MIKTIAKSSIFFIIISIVCGIAYPLVITGFAALLWPEKRHGSLIKEGAVVRGSALIAQKFVSPEYFWPRPSASNYQALPAFASNLGPTSKTLFLNITKRQEMLANISGLFPQEIPDMLVTSSASGLDPHISEEAMLFQLPRIIETRRLDQWQQKTLAKVIEEERKKSESWLLGKAYINVLLLNIALDEAFGKIHR